MKHFIINMVLASLSAAVFAQNTAADKLFDKYSGKDGFTTVYISKYMFDLFAQIDSDDKDYQEFKEVTGKLSSIKILASEEDSKLGGINFYTEIMENLPEKDYKELMVVKEKDQDLKFLINEKDGMIRELLLVVGGSGDNVLISIQGEIDLETISKLSKSMNIGGMENLDKIDM